MNEGNVDGEKREYVYKESASFDIFKSDELRVEYLLALSIKKGGSEFKQNIDENANFKEGDYFTEYCVKLSGITYKGNRN